MSVARVTEIKTASRTSFDDALKQGIERADQTLKNVKAAWIAEQEVTIENGKVGEYKLLLKITFVLDE